MVGYLNTPTLAVKGSGVGQGLAGPSDEHSVGRQLGGWGFSASLSLSFPPAPPLCRALFSALAAYSFMLSSLLCKGRN